MASPREAFRYIGDNLIGRPSVTTRYAYLGGYTAIVVTHRGHRLLVDTRDRSLTPHLAVAGVWERNVELALLRLLRPGQRIVEIGANMGYHTLTMASVVGRTGHIDAFEPNPRMHELLTDSIFLNGWREMVTVHQSAVLDRTGPVKFQFQPRYVGGGNVVVPGYEDPRSQHIEVPGVRLDDVLGAGPPVDLLRMDAEGSEPLALSGAKELLRRSSGMRIMMEFSPLMMNSRADVPGFTAWLATLGFKAWRVLSSGALVAVATADLPNLPHCEIVLSRNVPPGAR